VSCRNWPGDLFFLTALVAAGCQELRPHPGAVDPAEAPRLDAGSVPADAEAGSLPGSDDARPRPTAADAARPVAADARPAPPAPPSADAAPEPPPGVEEEPVLYWKLDEAAGTTADDSSGHGLSGTYLPAATPPAPSPPVEPPLSFPNPRSRAFSAAQRQAVVLPMMPALLRPTQELTLSAWYRGLEVDREGAASDLISGGDTYRIRLRTDRIEAHKRGAGSVIPLDAGCSGAAPGHLDGKWHHVALVIGSPDIALYLDGQRLCTTPNFNRAFLYDRGTDFVVGRHGNEDARFDFDGNIDDVRVYVRALAPARVASLALRSP
jgi:hypothetical protein